MKPGQYLHAKVNIFFANCATLHVKTSITPHRKASIQTSKSTLPCSIVLVDVNDTGDQKVISFARLLEVVGDKTAALVESGELKCFIVKGGRTWSCATNLILSCEL